MHELSIAREILSILETLSNDYKDKNIIRVVVQIGEMRAVLPESLEYNFNIIKDGTDFSNAKLELEIIPLRFKCNECGYIFSFSDEDFECPKCQKNEYEIIQGNELQIKEIEVE